VGVPSVGKSRRSGIHTENKGLVDKMRRVASLGVVGGTDSGTLRQRLCLEGGMIEQKTCAKSGRPCTAERGSCCQGKSG
jgi:hypothetical protein